MTAFGTELQPLGVGLDRTIGAVEDRDDVKRWIPPAGGRRRRMSCSPGIWSSWRGTSRRSRSSRRAGDLRTPGLLMVSHFTGPGRRRDCPRLRP